MTVAQAIKKDIDKHYVGGHVQYSDLIQHLSNNLIDRGVPTKYQHIGYDKSVSGELAIFYFADKSILVINGFSVISAVQN